MFLRGFVSWWYSAGWRDQAVLAGGRLSRLSDYFSLTLLLRSLFSPFRQISADTVRGGLDVQLRAWADRLISRCIGAMIRTVLIIVGLISPTFEAIIAGLRLACWPLLPVLPLIGLILSLSGWVPWR